MRRPPFTTTTITITITTMLLTAAVVGVVTAGCTTSAEPAVATSTSPAVLPAELGHVHGAVLTGDGSQLLLATHSGLYEVSPRQQVQRVGPVIDLMGFSSAAGGVLLASGHPNPSTGLPAPAGLLLSGDGGHTWQVQSRGGVSDFHALTAVGAGAVAFDGTLRVSKDRRTWTTGRIDAEPFSIVATPTGSTVLATTAQGLRRSADGGRSFAPVPASPLLLLLAGDGRGGFYGLSPAGQLYRSRDNGTTWRATGADPVGTPEALAARGQQVTAVAGDRVLLSTDAGETFTSWTNR